MWAGLWKQNVYFRMFDEFTGQVVENATEEIFCAMPMCVCC